MKTNYELARLTAGGMGNYLDAPLYPSHKYSVETDLKIKKENRGSMNIDYALIQDYFSPSLKKEIEKLIKEWHEIKPAIGSEVFNDWVDACTTHFGGFKKALPHIRKFYPDFHTN